jgi:galactosamine-6-phosphate isomerase
VIQPQILPDYETLSQYAADWLVARLRERPSALVCLAAGSTPSRMYELLTERGTAEPTLFQRCRFIKLDEWCALAMDDPATCEHQLRAALVTPLGMSERYTAFESQPANPAAECARIASWLKQFGPIDMCVLGLGVNGHIGFNEPADFLEPHAHVARLAESSMGHAMLKRSTGQPAYGLTLGMADLMQSRRVLLLASGNAKHGPLEHLLSGRITTTFPASLLQLHPDVTLLCDAEAARTVVCSVEATEM